MSWAQPFPRTWMLRPSHTIFPLYSEAVNLAGRPFGLRRPWVETRSSDPLS